MLRAEQRLLGGALSGYLFGVLGREARAASRAVGGCDGDGTSGCEVRRVWVPSCATSSTSMAQAEAGGRWPFAGWRDAATRMWIVPGARAGAGGGALRRLRRRLPLAREAMSVASQCLLSLFWLK